MEYKKVKKALLCYTQDIIENKYIEALVDEFINLLSNDILTILEYLVYNYKKVHLEKKA